MASGRGGGDERFAPAWTFTPALRLLFDCDEGGATAPGAVWRRGAVRADGHGDDAERALVALSGTEHPCRSLGRWWPALLEAVRHDLPELARAGGAAGSRAAAGRGRPTIEPAGPQDRSAEAGDALAEVLRGGLQVPAYFARFQGSSDVEDAELTTLGERLHAATLFPLLPPAWRGALVAEAVAPGSTAAWAAVPGDNRTDLAQLAGDLLGADRPGGVITVNVDLWSIGEVRNRRTITVPPTWFADVWLVGAAEIDRHVVVALRPTGPASATARMLAPNGREVSATVHHQAGRWALGAP